LKQYNSVRKKLILSCTVSVHAKTKKKGKYIIIYLRQKPF
jgi:hypothetical protein